MNGVVIQTIERGTAALMVAGAMTMALSAPISLSLFALGSILLIFGWLASGKWEGKIESAASFTVTIPLVIFVAYAAATALYSDGEWSHTVRVLSSYLKLLLIPILLSISTYFNIRERLLNAFYAGCVFLTLLVWVDVVVNLPWSREIGTGFGPRHQIFTTYISQGMALNACAVIAWFKLVESASIASRLGNGFVLLAAMVSVFLLNGSRIGYLSGFVLLLLAGSYWLFHRRKWQDLVILVPVVASIFCSENLFLGINRAVDNISQYTGAGDLSATTSGGARLAMMSVAYDLWTTAPIFGHGLGDYRALSLPFFASSVSGDESNAIAPTNQLLFIASEMGLVGVVLFSWMLWGVLHPVFRELPVKKYYAAGLISIFIVDAMGHHPIWDAGERQISLMLLALVCLTPRTAIWEGKKS